MKYRRDPWTVMGVDIPMPTLNGMEVRLGAFSPEAVAAGDDEDWVERRAREGWRVRNRIHMPGGIVKYTIDRQLTT